MKKSKIHGNLSKQEKQYRLVRRCILVCLLVSLAILMMQFADKRFTVEWHGGMNIVFAILWFCMEAEAIIRILGITRKEGFHNYVKFDRAEFIYLVVSPIVIILSFFREELQPLRWVILLKMPNVLRRYNDYRKEYCGTAGDFLCGSFFECICKCSFQTRTDYQYHAKEY